MTLDRAATAAMKQQYTNMGSAVPQPATIKRITMSGQTESMYALLPDRAHARLAARTLVAEGFEAEHISMLTGDAPDEASVDTVREAPTDPSDAGGLIGGGTGAALGASLMAAGALLIPGVGALAAGPWLAALLGAGAGGVTGGVLGRLVGSAIPEDRHAEYEGELARGRVLMGLEGDPQELERARGVLLSSGATLV